MDVHQTTGEVPFFFELMLNIEETRSNKKEKRHQTAERPDGVEAHDSIRKEGQRAGRTDLKIDRAPGKVL